jgi:hypothetical protein
MPCDEISAAGGHHLRKIIISDYLIVGPKLSDNNVAATSSAGFKARLCIENATSLRNLPQ